MIIGDKSRILRAFIRFIYKFYGPHPTEAVISIAFDLIKLDQNSAAPDGLLYSQKD